MQLNYSKYADGLIPAIVQDDITGKVLMLGFMNEEALQKTKDTGKVCFYSRTRKRLWTKGEESGNFLELKELTADCDNDTLLVKAHPLGPVCHTGSDTCFGETNSIHFLQALGDTIDNRYSDRRANSYTSSLFDKGINVMAQKVGEEAIELVIEAKDDNDEKFLGEAADLLFHYMILLKAKGFSLKNVEEVLEERHNKKA